MIDERPLRFLRYVLFGVLVAAVASFFMLGGAHYFSLGALRESETWMHQNLSTPQTLALYFAGAMTWVICALPAATIIMLLAGALFGPWLGTAACVLATSSGAVISLLMSRFLFRDFVRRQFTRQSAIVEREYARSGSQYLIAMRLIPVMPYFITNLLFGLTSIRPLRFWLTSMIASIPAIFIYANAGSELAKITTLEDILTWRLVAALIALASLPFIGRFITKKFFKIENDPAKL